MQYRNINDGTLSTQRQLKAANPNTSFPRSWTEGTLKFLEVEPVQSTAPPEVGPYEVAVRDGVEQVEGNWVEKWNVAPMFTATEDATVDEQIAAYDARQLEQKREGMSASNEDLRVALNNAGVYQTLTASKTFIENPELDIRFQFAVTINRLDEWFVQATEGLMTDEQLDALFEAAA